jgi:hypothetical protein
MNSYCYTTTRPSPQLRSTVPSARLQLTSNMNHVACSQVTQVRRNNRLWFVARSGRSSGLWTHWTKPDVTPWGSSGTLSSGMVPHRHSSCFYNHNELHQGIHQFVALVGSRASSRSLNRMPRSQSSCYPSFLHVNWLSLCLVVWLGPINASPVQKRHRLADSGFAQTSLCGTASLPQRLPHPYKPQSFISRVSNSSPYPNHNQHFGSRFQSSSAFISQDDGDSAVSTAFLRPVSETGH